EGGLAESGRAGEEDVVERVAAAFGGADHDLQAFDGLGLSGEVAERERAQRGLGGGDGRGEGFGDVTEAFVVGCGVGSGGLGGHGVAGGYGVCFLPQRSRSSDTEGTEFRRSRSFNAEARSREGTQRSEAGGRIEGLRD